MSTSYPKFCYVTPTIHSGSVATDVIMVKRGVEGYWPCEGMTVEEANRRNDRFNATADIVEAYYAGSVFGWHVPAANPKNYTKDGDLVPTNKIIREGLVDAAV